MLKLDKEQLDWLCERIPDPARYPQGGRPAADKRQVLQGVFWVLDNGAKWKDLPSELGSKGTVHRWFKNGVEQAVFESLMRDAGRCVEERGGYRLYECLVDGTFATARGGGDGIGCTKAGKGVKIMLMGDARSLPVAVNTCSASPHESQLVQELFGFTLTEQLPERLIGDKACVSDKLDEQMAEMGVEISLPAPGKQEARKQDAGRSAAAPLQAAMARGARHRPAPALPPALHPPGAFDGHVPGFSSLGLLAHVAKTGFGIGSSIFY